MTFIIEEVTDPRTEYPPGDSPEVASRMLPLYSYLDTAEKMIGKYAPRHLRKSMLDSEDAISYVANYMMKGDWSYNEAKSVNPFVRRKNYGKFGIIEYRKNLSRKQQLRSIDSGERPISKFLAAPPDRCRHDEAKSRYVSNLMMVLTSSERKCIDMYFFQNMSVSEIAEHLKVKRQAVHQSLRRAVRAMRRAAGV